MGNALRSFASLMARLLPESVKKALYRSPWISGTIRRALNRASPTGLVEIQVAAGGLKGAKLLLDMQTEKDYWLGTYEPELQKAISDLVKPGMVAYDVGANIGYITLLLARTIESSGRVFAFEALPINLERLQVNLKLNGMETRVQVVPGAVADRSGMLPFMVGLSGGMGKVAGSAGREVLEGADSIQVQSTSLDAFVYVSGNPPPQIVKIDIEGGEVLALPGMRQLLAEARPLVLLELHGHEAAQVAWELLTGACYRICRMASGYQGVSSAEALDWKEYLVAFPTG